MHSKNPANFILLAIFTFCTSWIVGIICSFSDKTIVLEAAGLTAAVVIGLTIYAFTTKSDFTICGPFIFVLGMIFCVGGIFAAIFGFHFGLLWACLGVFVFSFYIVYDTQLIMGGTRKHQMSVDHYILASVMLYLDIINLFLQILRILGNK
jgi:FtsH-binding integral membrane protein